MLKRLLLRKKREEKERELESKKEERESLKKEESNLERAIEEIDDNTTQEEKDKISEMVDELTEKKDELAAAIKTLQEEIEKIENEIKEQEENDPAPAAPKEGARNRRNKGGNVMPENRRTSFFEMTTQERDAFVRSEEVQEVISFVRTAMREKRAINGAELTIPDNMLELIKENISKYSKLIKHIRLKPLHGTARQNIMGTIPEGIWTEACAALNELDISFSQVEVDGYKVGGFFAICNATLEDNDVNLAQEIINALGQAIGIAVDAAILYGTGTKMPLGIVTRLAQTTKPTGYSDKAPEWENLSEKNIIKLAANLEGAKFYAALVRASGNAQSKYAVGGTFWAMNQKTYTEIMARSVLANMNGAFVASINNTMPIIGGAIEILEFIPDNDVIGGYGSLYLLAERSGTKISQSEHVRFIEDNTVFKGTARYDGLPVIPEGFVAININNAAVTTSRTFPPDKANTTDGSEATTQNTGK